MSEFNKPSPFPTAISLPFWSAITAERLDLQYCTNCGHYIHYPRAVCPYCMGELLEWRTVSGRGTIYSYSIVRRAPSQAFADVPYTVALVDLDEGVRMMARVSDISENVRIGATVKVIFVTRGEYSVPEFKLWDKSSTGLG